MAEASAYFKQTENEYAVASTALQKKIEGLAALSAGGASGGGPGAAGRDVPFSER